MDKKIVCQNRRAAYDYFIDEVYEGGMVLLAELVLWIVTPGLRRVKCISITCVSPLTPTPIT